MFLLYGFPIPDGVGLLGLLERLDAGAERLEFASAPSPVGESGASDVAAVVSGAAALDLLEQLDSDGLCGELPTAEEMAGPAGEQPVGRKRGLMSALADDSVTGLRAKVHAELEHLLSDDSLLNVSFVSQQG